MSRQDQQPAGAPSATPPAPPQHSTAKYVLFSVVTVVFLVLDQASKIWIQRNVTLYKDEIPVIDGFLSIVHAENTGAAFGILNDSPYRMWVFAAFTLVAVGVLFQMLWQLPKDDKLQNVALGLIMSGALGNAIDRIAKQSVTDFIKVYTDSESASAWLIDNFGTNQWPSFNIADAAIVVGLGLFFVHFLFFEKDAEVEAAPPEKAVSTDEPRPRAAPAPEMHSLQDAAAPAAPAVSAGSSDDEDTEDPPTDPGEDPPVAGDDDAEGPTEMVDPAELRRLLQGGE